VILMENMLISAGFANAVFARRLEAMHAERGQAATKGLLKTS